MLEAVPNVSEGRNVAVISAVGDAFAQAAVLLDVHSDPDHHRSVFTLAGAELDLPVFMYGEVGAGRRPAFFRRGGLDRLAQRVGSGELTPDAGPDEFDPRSGVVLVGARQALLHPLAMNQGARDGWDRAVGTTDVSVSRRRRRHSDGGR